MPAGGLIILRTRTVLSFAVLVAVLSAPGAASVAQTLEIGTDVQAPNSIDTVIADVRTDIDLVRPATATGVLASATFQWTNLGCTAAAKLKFFRRQGNTLVFLTERGPFDTSANPTPVDLVPPVAVEEGDLIGIARVGTCGNPMTLSGVASAGYVVYFGDLTGDVSLSAADAVSSDVLAVHATGTATESVSRVIAAAASTQGNFGSFFRTGVQIFNPWTSSIAGRFVFHPAGVPGSPADPILTFTVGAGQTVSFPDMVATLGATGLGSLDVVLPQGSQIPIIVTRVFNDAGGSGTSGFTEDALNPDVGGADSAILTAGATGFLIAPSDTTHLRFNMGVRTLLSGASITLTVHDVTGAVVHSVSKVYPPTYFEQQTSDSFLGYTLQANDTIEVDVTAGSAALYGATTDNTTNDPSIQFARVVFAVL